MDTALRRRIAEKNPGTPIKGSHACRVRFFTISNDAVLFFTLIRPPVASPRRPSLRSGQALGIIAPGQVRSSSPGFSWKKDGLRGCKRNRRRFPAAVGVRWEGVEPSRLAAHGPQPCLSASSSTSAAGSAGIIAQQGGMSTVGLIALSGFPISTRVRPSYTEQCSLNT
jgi:hypothetical protein